MENQKIPSYTLTDDLQRFGQWLDETLGTELHRALDFILQIGAYIHKFIFHKYELTQTEQTVRSLLIILMVFAIFGLISILKTYLEASEKFKNK